MHISDALTEIGKIKQAIKSARKVDISKGCAVTSSANQVYLGVKQKAALKKVGADMEFINGRKILFVEDNNHLFVAR